MATILTTTLQTATQTTPTHPRTIAGDPTADDSTSPEDNKSLRITEPMDLVVLAYPLDPAKLSEFPKFYDTKIRSFMTHQKVEHAHAYIVGSDLVVLASKEALVPWITGNTAIQGLEYFLATPKPLEVTRLPEFYNPK